MELAFACVLSLHAGSSVSPFSESKAERTSSSTSEVAFLNRLRDFPSDSDSSGKRFAPKNKRTRKKKILEFIKR